MTTRGIAEIISLGGDRLAHIQLYCLQLVLIVLLLLLLLLSSPFSFLGCLTGFKLSLSNLPIMGSRHPCLHIALLHGYFSHSWGVLCGVKSPGDHFRSGLPQVSNESSCRFCPAFQVIRGENEE